MDFRQLLPEPGTVDVQALLSSLDLTCARAAASDPAAAHAGAERPYTVVNFVSSVDGRATLHGRSGGLGDDGDRALFLGLREQVDAVLAGTGTLRAERYGRMLGKEERRRRRVQLGRSPEPLACIISRTGDVPVDIPLFAEPEARVVIFAPAEIDTSVCAAQVEVVALDPGEFTLTTALGRLHSDYAIRSLLCEGGPTLFGALLHEGVVDELFLTLAPKLAGGGAAPTITAGPELVESRKLEISWLLERNGSLYLRYWVAG
jgi:riboflavin-specific deaminase-like protein